VQVIRFARQRLAAKDTAPAERAVLLAWLFHLVGDIHQPLHSSALFSRGLFPEGDRGGNSIKVKQSYNLHALWDGFPGSDPEFRVAKNRAIEFAQEEQWRVIGGAAAEAAKDDAWVSESEALARDNAYDSEVLGEVAKMEAANLIREIGLSERYLQAGGRIAERRLVEAGYRLGAVLMEIVRQ
jgi:hypothetical protein